MLENKLQSNGENELMAEVEESARAAVFLDEPSRYVNWRFDPNNEVNGHPSENRRYRVGQVFRNPSLVIASDKSGLPLGFAETVDNISGNKIEQRIKRFGLKKRYIKFEQLFADPNLEADLQLRILAGLGYIALTKPGYNLKRHVTFYTHPEIDSPLFTSFINYIGLEPQSEDNPESGLLPTTVARGEQMGGLVLDRLVSLREDEGKRQEVIGSVA